MRYDLDRYGFTGRRGRGRMGPGGGPRYGEFEGFGCGGAGGYGSGDCSPGYGGDYWWLGEREMERRGRRRAYDESYRRFAEAHRPRFSPVGGMQPAMGGGYLTRRGPRPLREPTRFSDWTRWF
jgi:hypothetical protein